MSETCENLRGAIASLAINPFHTDAETGKKVTAHIAECASCHDQYERDVASREKLEQKGYDPTHQVI